MARRTSFSECLPIRSRKDVCSGAGRVAFDFVSAFRRFDAQPELCERCSVILPEKGSQIRIATALEAHVHGVDTFPLLREVWRPPRIAPGSRLHGPEVSLKVVIKNPIKTRKNVMERRGRRGLRLDYLAEPRLLSQRVEELGPRVSREMFARVMPEITDLYCDALVLGKGFVQPDCDVIEAGLLQKESDSTPVHKHTAHLYYTLHAWTYTHYENV